MNCILMKCNLNRGELRAFIKSNQIWKSAQIPVFRHSNMLKIIQNILGTTEQCNRNIPQHNITFSAEHIYIYISIYIKKTVNDFLFHRGYMFCFLSLWMSLSTMFDIVKLIDVSYGHWSMWISSRGSGVCQTLISVDSSPSDSGTGLLD